MRVVVTKSWLALAAIGLTVSAFASLAGDADSPVGSWRTIDDKTGKPRAIVRIYAQGGEFFGRIQTSFTPGAETRKCVKCSDERKDQPIIGLVIVRHIQARDGAYEGGDILDPDDGRVYRCKWSLEDGGRRLKVRGYLGFSFIGRTQIWQREE